MDILLALIPLSLVFIGIAVLLFRWAVKSGQYDDMDGPAHSILFDEKDPMDPTLTEKKNETGTSPEASDTKNAKPPGDTSS